MLGELPQATNYYFPLALAFSSNSNEIKRMGSCYGNQTRVYFIYEFSMKSHVSVGSIKKLPVAEIASIVALSL